MEIRVEESTETLVRDLLQIVQVLFRESLSSQFLTYADMFESRHGPLSDEAQLALVTQIAERTMGQIKSGVYSTLSPSVAALLEKATGHWEQQAQSDGPPALVVLPGGKDTDSD